MSELMRKRAEKEIGLHDLMYDIFESIKYIYSFITGLS